MSETEDQELVTDLETIICPAERLAGILDVIFIMLILKDVINFLA